MPTPIPDGTVSAPIHVKELPPEIHIGPMVVSFLITAGSVAAFVIIQRYMSSPDAMRTLKMRAYLSAMNTADRQAARYTRLSNNLARAYSDLCA